MRRGAILLASLAFLAAAQGADGAILPTAHVGASAEAARYARSQAKLERSRERVKRLEKRLREARKRIGALEAAVSVSSLPPPTSSPAVTGGAAASSASSGSVDWYAIAACESGGDWSADTGNGFYGGLQFTMSTWLANGGSGNPADASAAEQIRVAENVLASQGIGAWPVCGSRG